MSLTDLLILLRQDLNQTFRFVGTGRRSEQKSVFRRFLGPIIAIVVAVVIILAVTWIVPLIGWNTIAALISQNLAIGSTLFNIILLFSFIGSIMVSATTVANSQRMEYLMTMPISLRTLFLEKTIIIIVYSSLLWLVIGTPLIIGFAIVSPLPLAFLAIISYLVFMLVLVTIGVAFGGLLGLLFSRIVAGRRRLRQVGYFLMSTLAILFSVIWYYFLYSSEDSALFEWFFQLAEQIGLTSDLTPGYSVSVIILGLLVGADFGLIQILVVGVYALFAGGLAYLNAVVSEKAHYSGWLMSGSKRSSKEEIVIEHEPWDPQPIPGFTFNKTISASIWYNITNVRRESRVFARYLMGPLQFVIFFFIPVLTNPEGMGFFTPFLIIAALIPFSTSYGLYFAGYETVYEGRNLLNLQLAATNMEDYVRGKIYSAVPFTIAASSLVGVLILLVYVSFWFYIPLIIGAAVFTNLASGAVAANAAAIGGDFKAQRMVTRQRGSSVQMPIRGWSILRAQLLPNVIGYLGTFSMIILGLSLGAPFAYLALPIYGVLCWQIMRHYSRSAGLALARIEASEYL
ncbi:hypothetical protein EU538_07325 [Candidatus Thorarchaeota archaeon]|nr:MAG: hypothetical protein EU538_07325 [Candidatus Thorarchaeota archaeon]